MHISLHTTYTYADTTLLYLIALSPLSISHHLLSPAIQLEMEDNTEDEEDEEEEERLEKLLALARADEDEIASSRVEEDVEASGDIDTLTSALAGSSLNEKNTES